MSDAESVGGSNPMDDSTVAFEYIKSADFRTVWADGAVGGVTPSGFVHLAVYSERPAIPRRQVFSVVDDGEAGQRLGTEIIEKRISRDAIVREMPVDIMMSASVAESLATWLTQQVELIRSTQKVVK
ncbi:MAG: hypothetical protein HC844_12150 [Tabrizicola sp.]|nr:hypothetical protein [Tabrizicola sp.]